MFLPYLLTFSRVTIGLIFAYSFLSKARDVGQFAQTITNFKLLSPRWSRPLALLFLSAELAVVVLVLVDGRLLPLAFGLAFLLLIVFTIVLASTLARNIQTTCNCFGSSERLLDYADVWRNAGLVLVAGAGLWATGGVGDVDTSLTFIELLFMSIIAGAFALLWANLNDIVSMFYSAASERR